MVLTCSSLGACGAPCLAVPTPVAIPVPGTRLWPKDRALDQYSSGPLWLRHPQIADVVAHAIAIGQDERQFYELCAWVVMPNHVHLLILPTVAVGRTGRPFWQDESYDHYLRDHKSAGPPPTLSRILFVLVWRGPQRIGLGPVQAGRRNRLPHPPPYHQDKM
jgi:hypothetical protein